MEVTCDFLTVISDLPFNIEQVQFNLPCFIERIQI